MKVKKKHDISNTKNPFSISTCTNWQVDFLPCKAEIRRYPDGW